MECGIDSATTNCNCDFPSLGCCFLSLVVPETLLNPGLDQPNLPGLERDLLAVSSDNFLLIAQRHWDIRNTSLYILKLE